LDSGFDAFAVAHWRLLRRWPDANSYSNANAWADANTGADSYSDAESRPRMQWNPGVDGDRDLHWRSARESEQPHL
jgi:hypothetical protein